MPPSNHLLNTVALSLVKNMGPVTYKKLIEKFGSAQAVFEAPRKALNFGRQGGKISPDGIKDPALFTRAQKEIETARNEGVDMIPFGDERYPSSLREIHDPPIVLYVKGVLPAQEALKVAVVGSRVASIYGKKMAGEISRGLAAAGVVIVSGLALGIDSAAHEGALEADGVTVAVLGGGIARLYPRENKKLAEKICRKGALISEYPVRMNPEPSFFPVRNRIISGLSSGVLVVEAKEKSGALITADMALEQNRDVFALPGNADSSKSMGTNALLKQGARLILSAQDVLTELGYSVSKKLKADKRAALTAEQEKVYSVLEAGPVQLDEMVDALGFSLQKTLTVLSYLEMKGLIQEAPGKFFQKA